MIHLWTNSEINTPDFYHYDLLRQLGRTFSVKPRVDHKAGGTGVHVLMVLARWLFLNQDWFNRLEGPKILVEHDAYLNFMPESTYYHCWTKLYRNCNFNLIISSGKETTNRLRQEGIPAVWVPKGTNSEFLDMPNESNGLMGQFSMPIAEQETGKEFYFYKSRHEMSNSLDLPAIACPFSYFASTVSHYSGVVTNDVTMGEPMAKQFECSALGAAVIRDLQPELYDLGYVEGESVISYTNLDSLAEIVEHYKGHPEELTRIGKNAREVARNHTWAHRSREIAEYVKPYIPHRIFV